MVDERKIDIIKSTKPFKALDLLIVGVFTALIVFLVFFSYRNDGDSVRISYNGVNAEYPLYIDREIVLDDKITICIENKTVFVESSDCPDRVCVHTGAISRQNQTIVCAPFGVVIKIVSMQSDWI